MRSDRRRELQANELATWMGHQVEKHREHLPAVLWGALAVAAAVVLFTMWNTRHSGSQSSAWDEFHHIGSIDVKARPKRLKELAERYPTSQVALWARLDLADHLCHDGASKLEIDRELAMTHLREAQQTYAQVVQNPKALPEMVRRAAIAEGKCWELMGNREKAIETYRAAAKRFESSDPDLADDATRRATELEQPEAADFYKWLSEYKPPASKPLPIPGLGSFPPDNIDASKPSDATGSDPAPGTELKPNQDSQKQPGDESPATKSDNPDAPAPQKSDDTTEPSKPAGAEPAPKSNSTPAVPDPTKPPN